MWLEVNAAQNSNLYVTGNRKLFMLYSLIQLKPW